MSWYEASYRKLFFDFHSSRHAVGLASGFNAKRWAELLKKANAQAVSVFAKCACGWSYYRGGTFRHVHPQLPDGLDMVVDQIEALHHSGIKAIGYYATLPSEPLVEIRPEWREVDGDGESPTTGICMHSAAFEEWVIPHVREIVSLHDLDAMFFDGTFPRDVCYCDACRAKFSSATGGSELPTSPGDENYGAFVAWRLSAFRRIREILCAEIHDLRPEMPVSFNWAYTMRLPEEIPGQVGSLVADIFPEDQCFNGSYQAHGWALSGKPFDIMNSAFLRWWGDWGCKPAVGMQQEVSTILANGGLAWIGYQMNEKFQVENAVMEELGKALAFVGEREELVKGSSPLTYAAVLRSRYSNTCADQPDFYVDETTPRGVHRVMSESMIPYHTVDETILLERMEEFQLIIIPDQRFLSSDLVSALADWVERGGTLVATAFSGTRDQENTETGRSVLEPLLGVEVTGRYGYSHAYVNTLHDGLDRGTLDMAHMVECPVALVRVTDPEVEVWAGLSSVYLRADGQYLLSRSPVGAGLENPAITVKRVGRGHAAYVAAELCHAYQTNNQWNAKLLFANLIRELAPEPPVTVTSDPWLELVPTHRGDDLIVHLVNHHGDRPIQSWISRGAEPSPQQYTCVQSVPPIHDVQVKINRPDDPIGVSLEPGGVEPTWSRVGRSIHVQVPRVDIHLAVFIRF